MPVASRSASLSMSKNSRLLFGNHASARLRVASVTATTITVDSTAELTGLALYAVASPGQAMISSAAVAGNQGKTNNVTGISGSVLTVTTDWTALLAAGDIITVAPPLSVELYLNGGHTLNDSLTNDYTRGLTETFDTHNTPMVVDVGGDVPFYQILTSEGFARLLALGMGAYKTPSSGTHKFRPIEANDGTFTNLEDGTFWAQDGNGVLRRLFFGGMATRLTLDYPEGGLATGSITYLGSGSVREIGGTGRTFTTGANNYVRSNFVCDTGPRLTFRSAFMELGGAFGGGLTSAAETTVKNLTVTIDRGAVEDRTLGDPNIIKPEELEFTVSVTGTRILQNDAIHELAQGGADNASPSDGSKGETRLLVKAISANDPTKTLTIDIPRGSFSTHDVRRDRGRFTEDFEFRSLATLDGSGCVSTSVPPIEITLLSSVTKNLSTAL